MFSYSSVPAGCHREHREIWVYPFGEIYGIDDLLAISPGNPTINDAVVAYSYFLSTPNASIT
jgi:hypothetical protein